MDTNSKYFARVLFQNQIYKSEGNTFEQLFSSIMFIYDKDFNQIKPWGNLGDRKCDGCNRKLNTYYQVYAPEIPENSYKEVISKLTRDFKGLITYWSPVEKFFFVFNDKYKGINAESVLAIDKIKKDYKLLESGFILPKDLSKIVFDNFSDDEIIDIVGTPPNPDSSYKFDEKCFEEIIDYLLNSSPQYLDPSKLIVPNWDDKIRANNISPLLKMQLSSAYTLVGTVDKFFLNREVFWGDLIRDKLNSIYNQVKDDMENYDSGSGYKGDDIFWLMVDRILPEGNNRNSCIPSAIQLLAKYFESCDIFEEP